MDCYADTASFVAPVYMWANAPYEPKREVQRTLRRGTEFVTGKATPIDFFSSVTGPLAPTVEPRAQLETFSGTTSISESTAKPTVGAAIPQPNAEVDLITKQRVRLLAIKYAGGVVSSEIVARLEILNSRLTSRAPRVSRDQVLALENASEQLMRIRAAREARSKPQGISA